ncbi:uncharacterized protein [Nicotiana sylvestris]|uniref:Uncharacterized protein LOC104250199 n=1 Tax=Nicotiana sylvestris TaxID=4096 RepID=A0A1U7YLY2_NICSY|nr:PREDICTED: uncharacterized protein LOC104250199 [Nicotiana sylvestris]
MLPAMETFRDEGVHGEEDPFRSYFVGVEDACGMVGLVVPMKSSSEASLSLRLTNQFPSSSVDHGCKRSIIISVLEDARVLSALVGVANYLRRFVTEEDQDKMYVVESTCLFNEAQQALNRVSVLHHKTFLRFREELGWYVAEVWGLTKENDAFKLLSEQRKGEAKGFRVELEMA